MNSITSLSDAPSTYLTVGISLQPGRGKINVLPPADGGNVLRNPGCFKTTKCNWVLLIFYSFIYFLLIFLFLFCLMDRWNELWLFAN